MTTAREQTQGVDALPHDDGYPKRVEAAIRWALLAGPLSFVALHLNAETAVGHEVRRLTLGRVLDDMRKRKVVGEREGRGTEANIWILLDVGNMEVPLGFRRGVQLNLARGLRALAEFPNEPWAPSAPLASAQDLAVDVAKTCTLHVCRIGIECIRAARAESSRWLREQGFREAGDALAKASGEVL